jgi:hypothetical protein
MPNENFAKYEEQVRAIEPALYVYVMGAVICVAIGEKSGSSELKQAKSLAKTLGLSVASVGEDEFTASVIDNSQIVLGAPRAGTFKHE